MIQRNNRIPTSLMALLAVLAMMVTPNFAQAGNLDNVNEKLSYVEVKAREARQHIGTLQTFARFPTLYSHQSHTRKLMLVRDAVNEIAGEVAKMHKNRSELKTWQAELVTRMLPKMESLASDTEHAIRFIESKPTASFRPVYESYIDDMYDASNGIVRVVDNFLDWADENADRTQSSE